MTTTPPRWAQILLTQQQEQQRPANGLPVAAPGSAPAYATAALNDELSILAGTSEGARNDQLNKSAFNLGQLVAGGHLAHDDTWDALHVVARSIGLSDSESMATLASAFRAAEKTPRSPTEYGIDEPPPVTTIDPGHLNADRSSSGEAEEEDPEPPTLRDRFPALDWHELWADETEDEWIIEPLLPARRFVALFSPPKIGKSLLMLEIAVAVARGQEILGHQPDRPRRVLYVDFENDPRGDIRTRLQAMGREPEELADLVYLSYPRLAHLDTTMGAIELLAVCAEYEVEVVVIDTISRAVGGDENDNDTWLGLYRNTGLALKQAGIAAIRLDHTGKDPLKGMRGGSAKYGDVDAVWSMTALTDSTLRLECTANRLPIAEKILIIERRTDPLQHAITTRRTGEVLRDEATILADHLDRLGIHHQAGRPSCEKALKQAGVAFSHRRLRDAIEIRKERLTALQFPLDPDDPPDDPAGQAGQGPAQPQRPS